MVGRKRYALGGLVLAGTFATGWFARNALDYRSGSDSVNAAFSAVGAVANVVMGVVAVIAVMAVDAWRSQLKGTKERDVAEAVLRSAVRLEGSLRNASEVAREQWRRYRNWRKRADALTPVGAVFSDV